MSIALKSNSSLIDFMFSGGYTWYDTSNVTTTTLIDRGPGGFNATMSTVIPSVAGPYPNMRALAFSGGNTITCPTGYTTGDFSISYWVFLVDKPNTGGLSTYQFILTGGRVSLHQYFGNTQIAYNNAGTVSFPQTGGVWTHLTYVYTTSGTTNITVYQNGVQVASANTSINAAGNFVFGDGSITFISRLSDIRIVPFRLTAAQALTLYNSYILGLWGTPSIPPQMRMSNQIVITQTTTFLGTGSVQTWTVPRDVFGLKFFLWGAGGVLNSQGGAGGGGGYVEGSIFVTPGQVLNIVVGRPALSGIGNGGGSAGAGAGGGGGFSGIFSASPAVGTVIAIAGGGGGSGVWGGGGGGGYPNGQTGTGAGFGSGGTQTSGGVGGSWLYKGGEDGTQLAGGNAGTVQGGGGGGGGGWWGGGGGFGPTSQGYGGGGGGGSSTYTSSVVGPITSNGGYGGAVGGTSSPYYVSPYGGSGQNGYVVLGYNAFPLSINFNSYIGPFGNRTNFTATGSVQTFTVPANIRVVRIFCWGAGGVGQNGSIESGAAGTGAYAAGSYAVFPGQSLFVVVGRAGQSGIGNGGGSGGGTSAGGGGFSGVFIGVNPATSLSTNPLLIAGGGGGAGFNGGGTGGGGGYPNGLPGVGTQSQGGGGTQRSGGAGGVGGGSAGSQFAGGAGGFGDNGGGGGGGGWFGGGGGVLQGAGGGGSGYASPLLKLPEFVNGTTGGVNAANQSSPYWVSPYGRAGRDGLVVIAY